RRTLYKGADASPAREDSPGGRRMGIPAHPDRQHRLRAWPLHLCAALALLSAACTQPQQSAKATRSDADPLPLMESVADWQLAQIGTRTGYPLDINRATWDPRGWIQGAFFVGLADLATRSSEPRFINAVLQRGTEQRWRPGDRPLHADDQVIG